MNSKLSNLLKPVSLNAVVVLMLATCCLFLHVKNFVHSWAIFLTRKAELCGCIGFHSTASSV